MATTNAYGFSANDSRRIARAVKTTERLAPPTLGGTSDARRGIIIPPLTPVTVSMTSGSPGTTTTRCTFFYNYTDPSGHAHTDEGPIWSNRPSIGVMGAGINGLCQFFDGAWRLYMVDEYLSAEACGS